MRAVCLLGLIFSCIIFAEAELPFVRLGSVAADAEYKVWMPGASDPVVFQLNIVQAKEDADSLSDVSFVIESRSSLDNTAGEKRFTAYVNGTLTTFASDRMTVLKGEELNRKKFDNILFINTLPAFIGNYIESMANDTSNFKYSVIKENDAETVKGSQYMKGFLMRTFEYRFDKNGLPVSFEIVNNPDEPTEQIVSVKYSNVNVDVVGGIDDKYLKTRYPDDFARFHPDSLRPESFVDRPMPSFAFPEVDKKRISHVRGQSFRRPTIIVVLEPDESVPDIMRSMINAEKDFDLIFAFTGRDIRLIEELSGESDISSKTVVYNGDALARDMGAKQLPLFVACSADGTVEKVATGFNKAIEKFVSNLSNN